MLASGGGDAARLAAVLRRAPLLVEALRVARAVDAPDWLVNAGAIRDAVWDAAHGRPPTAAPRDIDLGFFDPEDLTPARDAAVEAALRAGAAHLPWEAKNQAAVHRWYPRVFGAEVPPFRSTVEAMATFPETASCVGVRLLSRRRPARRRPVRSRRSAGVRVPPQPGARAAGLLRAAGRGEALGRPLAADALRRAGQAARLNPRANGEQLFALCSRSHRALQTCVRWGIVIGS